ncbi:hypothetical protein FACS189496_1050 [Bacilli bacterium]|nr:hypothetical protein FACS189496_1050 [Bacilli bacterium]
MTKKIMAMFLIFIFFTASISILMADIFDAPGKVDDYIPNIKVGYMFSNDPGTTANTLTTDSVFVKGQPFYLVVFASISCPSSLRSFWGPKKIECGVSFRSPQIVQTSIAESSIRLYPDENYKPSIVYAFQVPINAKENHKIIFRCEPQGIGTQEIRIVFDQDLVDLVYVQTYSITIKEE